MTVPAWIQDAIFYQIFPDRFANGNPDLDPPNAQPWGAEPTPRGFQGGDLEGVIQRLDYLLELGITAIYLNPIFHATSNHRYNTTDYFKIDPKLGTLADFHRLLERAHACGIRIILDGVFNHCGRGHFAFNDVLENGQDSPYKDWFHIKKVPVEAYGAGEALHFEGWWGHKSLPRFNTDTPAVRRYLLDVARYWIDQGIDGWRLDVPNEIDDDDFWAEFRATVKAGNPQAYILGEIWEVNPRWVGEKTCDGLMNYPFRTTMLEFVAEEKLTASACLDRLAELLAVYPRKHAYAQFNPLGSHDTERVATICRSDYALVKLLSLVQFTYPGAPSIYYGDEIGLQGGKDPDSRRAFLWNRADWNRDLWTTLQALVALRKRHPVLRRGDFVPLFAENDARLLAFARTLGREMAIVALNVSSATRTLNLNLTALDLLPATLYRDALTGKAYPIENGHLELKLSPEQGILLV